MGVFRRRKPTAPPPEPAAPPIEDVPARQFAVKIALLARSSDGLRLIPSSASPGALARLVEPLTEGSIETVEPLPRELAAASSSVERVDEAEQWIVARRNLSPVARHAVYVLEQTDAVDMTVDALICGLLNGETDTAGYPDYAAVVGGLASHFDEVSGDLIVRAVVGWGGRGQRGDTERIAQRILSNLHQQILSSGLVRGSGEPGDAPTDGGTGLSCTHCGFDSDHAAFYCPKCGMRMARTV
jgi:hypothetical protein